LSEYTNVDARLNAVTPIVVWMDGQGGQDMDGVLSGYFLQADIPYPGLIQNP